MPCVHIKIYIVIFTHLTRSLIELHYIRLPCIFAHYFYFVKTVKWGKLKKTSKIMLFPIVPFSINTITLFLSLLRTTMVWKLLVADRPSSPVLGGEWAWHGKEVCVCVCDDVVGQYDCGGGSKLRGSGHIWSQEGSCSFTAFHFCLIGVLNCF